MKPGHSLAEAAIMPVLKATKVRIAKPHQGRLIDAVHKLVDDVRRECMMEVRERIDAIESKLKEAAAKLEESEKTWADRIEAVKALPSAPTRERLPDERRSITRTLRLKWPEDGTDFDTYVTCGVYPDGRLGEIFLRAGKEGETLGGVLDALATSISIGLQYGIPLEVFVNKFKALRFEPAGFTGNPEIPRVTSPLDYLFRFLEKRFLPAAEPEAPVEEVLA